MNQTQPTQQTQTNKKINFSNRVMTNCHKGGIKIRNNKNEYNIDPFAGIEPILENTRENIKYDNSSYNSLDLNIENYSRPDLFKLFGLNTNSLTEDIMRECKKIVLKTHPDKSHLAPEYFLFFSKAYKKIFSIYEFQNKTAKKMDSSNEYSEYSETKETNTLLDKVFEQKKELKTTKNFNNWFNEQFDKYKLEDTLEECVSGYGDWLKSDEDIVFISNVSKTNMASKMEERKKIVQSLTPYNGVNDSVAVSSGGAGSALMEYNTNFTSDSLFCNDSIGYTDLRQAYVESVIPVTEDDFHKMNKFASLNEYKQHRDGININPLNKEEATKILFQRNKQKDEESAALAFYYAQQTEKMKENQHKFWSNLKQLTNH